MGNDLLLDLQACASSSFQRPLRFYERAYLQERTRAVEEGRGDPERPPSGGNFVLKTYRLAESGASIGKPLRPAPRGAAPVIRWCGMNPAAVGRLRNIADYLDEDLKADSRYHMKISLTPEQHEAVRAGLPVSRRGDHAPARGSPAPAVCHRSAASYVRHALRPVRGHWSAGQRTIAPRPR